jgi:hypothetical protein
VGNVLRILFLDDDPKRATQFKEKHSLDNVIWVKTADECIAQLKENNWDEVHLDHDLEGKVFVNPAYSNTGSGVVRWITENEKVPHSIKFIIHSLNSGAALDMIKLLRNSEYDAIYRPFEIRGQLDLRDMIVDAMCDPESVDMPGAIIINKKEED